MADDANRPEEAEDISESDAGIGVDAARAKLGELTLRAGYGNERVRLTRKGKPIAVLIGMKDFARLESLDPRETAVA
jgi:prevent-host-death family protein